MQTDFHYYATLFLALEAGLSPTTARRIAWANQRTDEETEPGCPCQTQVAIEIGGNWDDPVIQKTVIVPFHFVPGGKPDWSQCVVEHSQAAESAVYRARDNEYQLGIALHAFQDTYTHQGFSGLRDDRNSCYPWMSPVSLLPNIGHAEMRSLPDIANAIWTDPRTGSVNTNQTRCMRAARATWDFLGGNVAGWIRVQGVLRNAFATQSYEDRKAMLKYAIGPHPTFTENDYRRPLPELDMWYNAAKRHRDGVLGVL